MSNKYILEIECAKKIIVLQDGNFWTWEKFLA